MGSTLERHPFSGLIHSAGELFSWTGALSGPGRLYLHRGACHGQLRLVCGRGSGTPAACRTPPGGRRPGTLELSQAPTGGAASDDRCDVQQRAQHIP